VHQAVQGHDRPEVEVRLAVGAAGGMPTAEDWVDIKVLLRALNGGRSRDDEGAGGAGAADTGDAQAWHGRDLICRLLQPVASTGRTTQAQGYRPGLVGPCTGRLLGFPSIA
jgi:hypothetical protein